MMLSVLPAPVLAYASCRTGVGMSCRGRAPGPCRNDDPRRPPLTVLHHGRVCGRLERRAKRRRKAKCRASSTPPARTRRSHRCECRCIECHHRSPSAFSSKRAVWGSRSSRVGGARAEAYCVQTGHGHSGTRRFSQPSVVPGVDPELSPRVAGSWRVVHGAQAIAGVQG